MILLHQITDLIHAELSHKIIGCAFKVYNQIGAGHLEKVYQKALQTAFETQQIKYLSQPSLPIFYSETQVGTVTPDFVVEDKVVVEIKRKSNLLHSDFKQATKYLTTMNLQLALLIHFGKENVKVKRVVNL